MRALKTTNVHPGALTTVAILAIWAQKHWSKFYLWIDMPDCCRDTDSWIMSILGQSFTLPKYQQDIEQRSSICLFEINLVLYSVDEED